MNNITLITDELGYKRLDRMDGDDSYLIEDEYGFIRLDARAGMTLCTPGRTVPCGKACRQPKNCAKGKGAQERKTRIGEENLKEFASARQGALKDKRETSQFNAKLRGKALESQSKFKGQDNLKDKERSPKPSTQSGNAFKTERIEKLSEADFNQIKSQADLAKSMAEKDSRFDDNASVHSNLALTAEYVPERLRVAKDNDGNIQASASVTNEGDALNVAWLATAPWNMDNSDPRKTKGAGTAVMEEIVKEAIENNIPVSLAAFTDAIPFYEKIGFVNDPKRGSDYFELSVEAGKKFLERRGVRMDALDKIFEMQLQKLEDRANGAFAKGDRVKPEKRRTSTQK